MKLSLLVTQGASKGKEIPITPPEFLIGRDAACHLRPSSNMISRRHCGLFVRGEQVFVRDFGSTNGTIVNEERIKGEQELHNDDKLRLDSLVFIVRIDATASGERPSRAPTKSQAEVADEEAIAALLMELQKDEQPLEGPTELSQSINPGGTTVLQTPPPPGDAGPPGKAKGKA
jgi:pSer/pThr/pTyr-binding forkhead associated (FHA) protein